MFFLVSLGFSQCPNNSSADSQGDFEAVAVLAVGTWECESVGVRMKVNSYRWCLLKTLIACSKILPAT